MVAQTLVKLNARDRTRFSAFVDAIAILIVILFEESSIELI